jgi:hypothetical protein
MFFDADIFDNVADVSMVSCGRLSSRDGRTGTGEPEPMQDGRRV